MRIVHVLSEPHGGGGAYALALARATADRGDQVSFVSPRPLSRDFETTSLNFRGPLAALRACRAADVLHAHGVRAGTLALVPLGRPVVITLGGLHAARSRRGAIGALARAVTRVVLGGCDRVICVSEAERDFAVRLAPSGAPRFQVVLNGVAPRSPVDPDERASARAELGLAPAQPVLLFVGGLRDQKHPELAIEAVRIAQRAVEGLVLLLAGDGPLRETVRAATGPGIELLGQRGDVNRLLAATDAVINSSRWEGLPFALLEAFWRGRPAVVTDVPGNGEAVGESGLLVPDDDPEAMAEAVRELFLTPGLLARLGASARARAQRLFDERRMIGQTLAVYDAALSSGTSENLCS